MEKVSLSLSLFFLFSDLSLPLFLRAIFFRELTEDPGAIIIAVLKQYEFITQAKLAQTVSLSPLSLSLRHNPSQVLSSTWEGCILSLSSREREFFPADEPNHGDQAARKKKEYFVYVYVVMSLCLIAESLFPKGEREGVLRKQVESRKSCTPSLPSWLTHIRVPSLMFVSSHTRRRPRHQMCRGGDGSEYFMRVRASNVICRRCP